MPLLLGEDPSDAARPWDRLAWQAIFLGRGRLSYQATYAFDTELYDINARAAGLPLSKLLGVERCCADLQFLRSVPSGID